MNDLAIISDDPQALQLAKDCSSALAECNSTMQIWSHRRSGLMLRSMTVGSEYTPMRKLRQVIAEMQNKESALVDNKYKIQLRLQDAKIYAAKAEKETDPLLKGRFEIKAQEQATLAESARRPYVGAMREVMELKRLHDALVLQIKEKYGKVDEEIFEREEARYYIKRIFAQSLRYIRQQGTINTGNQEVLEQLGLDPLYVQRMLSVWLQERESSRTTGIPVDISSRPLEQFLEQCADKFEQAVRDKTERDGLPTVSAKEYLFINKELDPSGDGMR